MSITNCKKCGDLVDTDSDPDCYINVRIKQPLGPWGRGDANWEQRGRTEIQAWCELCREDEGLNHYRDRV